MIRQFAYATFVVFALVACASDEEVTTDTGTSGATTDPSSSGTGTGGVQGGRLPGSYPGAGGAGGAGGGSSAQAQQEVTQVGDTVFFGSDRYDLDDRAQRTLDSQAAVLLRFPQVGVVIEGFCDERGTREYNLALGERRANAVKEYLVALGVGPNRMRAVSFGEERPRAVGSSEGAWAQNRRAVTVVVSGAPAS